MDLFLFVLMGVIIVHKYVCYPSRDTEEFVIRYD